MSPFATPQERAAVRLVTRVLAAGHCTTTEAAEAVVALLDSKGALDLDALPADDDEAEVAA